MRTIADTFWSKVDVRGPTECWPWLKGSLPRGYGRFWHRVEGDKLAHRMVWEFEHGPIPKGLFVCHHCDNPPCVNPNHLYLGDQDRNMGDCSLRGRVQRGVGHWQAKLTDEQVIAIRSATEPQRATAKRFGIAQSRVSKIQSHIEWKHVQEAN